MKKYLKKYYERHVNKARRDDKEGEDVHELDDRKLTILKAIIKNYLEKGEPVGSRTISKLTDLNLSSATIRNEMSDLEDMGYIFQPHTSAGRIQRTGDTVFMWIFSV